jgi:hypothetical protein
MDAPGYERKEILGSINTFPRPSSWLTNPLRIPKGFWLVSLLCLAFPASLAGQVPDSLGIDPDPVVRQRDTLPTPPTVQEEAPGRITPRGAFIRSGLLPGYGHAKVGAYGRGAFYFLVEAIAGFMVVKTNGQVQLAKDRRVLWETVMSERLQADGALDYNALEAALAEDPRVEDLRGLEEARKGQMEDWVALSIFFLFLGGADAYVSAHLADFPGAVEVNANPSGGVEVGFSLPVGF